MTGIEKYNFPEFDKAERTLSAMGHTPVNPANIDRALGFDGSGPMPDWFTVHSFSARDLCAIDTCDALLLLEGWEDSRFGAVEIAYALATKKKFFRLSGDNSLHTVHIHHPIF